MTKIIFACPECKRKEIEKANKELELFNKDKHFWEKARPAIHQSSYMKEASEIRFIKDSQQDELGSGLEIKCSFCNTTSYFTRGSLGM